MENATSINDVARYAGVSTKTVSRVINNEPNVAERTRTKVLAAIEALSYTPSISARILAGNRSYRIQLLCRTPQSDYFAGIQFAALSVCQEMGYILGVSLLEDIHELDAAALSARLNKIIQKPYPDGLLLTPPFCDDPAIIDFLQQRNIAYVKISPRTLSADAPSVAFDEQQAAFEITQHLIDLGHKHIAFIRGNPTHGGAIMRENGFLEALSKHGLTVDPAFMCEGDFHFPSGLSAGNTLFAMTERPTAVFACNDEMAAGVSIAAHRAGLTIPDEVSIVGFDDSSVAQLTWPALTTVRQPLHELSTVATNLLIGHKTSANDDEVTIMLDYELVHRESTGSAPV